MDRKLPRRMLSDVQWRALCPKLHALGLYKTGHLRQTLDGILWRLRTGAPWRDLPSAFGPWHRVFTQFNRWSARGIWMSLFETLRVALDTTLSSMDSTIVKAHQHAAGSQGESDRAIGLSRGGKTTKIHMLTDGQGRPVHFEITAGQVHDVTQAISLLAQNNARCVVNDKGYDGDALRQAALAKGIVPVIPRKRNSARANDTFDATLYKKRHLIENLIAKLKQFRALATRYDKLKRNFVSVVALCCAWTWFTGTVATTS